MLENRTSHWLLELANVVSIGHIPLSDAETDIGHIQATFDNVPRNVYSVNVRKTTIGHQLSQLQSRLLELRRLCPYEVDTLLQFASGMHFFYRQKRISN